MLRLLGMLLCFALLLLGCRTLQKSEGANALSFDEGTKRPKDIVYAKNGGLFLNGQPYYFYSSNTYRMLESPQAADQAFAAAKKLGLNAIRIWGFAHGEAPNNRGSYLFYNESPGQWPTTFSFPEERWRQFDYVLKRANDEKIRLIIPLNNFWDNGTDVLARWTGQAPDQSDLKQREMFYANPRAREIYKTYTDHVMNRVNSLTGIPYKNDPMILMWEPMNEPRGRTDPSGKMVTDWLDWAAGTIKTQDPYHMVGSGTEGFLADFTPQNPYPGLDYEQAPFHASKWFKVSRLNPETSQTERAVMVPEGIYFPNDCASKYIDACSIHAWPYNWSVVDDPNKPVFVAAFMRAHREALDNAGIKKPLYMAEFGRQVVRGQPEGLTVRDAIVKEAYAEALRLQIDGMGYWHLGFGTKDRFRGYLSFDILCDPHGDWDSTCDIVTDYVAKASQLPTTSGRQPDVDPSSGDAPPTLAEPVIAPSEPIAPTPVQPIVDASGNRGGGDTPANGNDHGSRNDTNSTGQKTGGACAQKMCPNNIDTSGKSLCNANDPKWYCLYYNGCWCVVR